MCVKWGAPGAVTNARNIFPPAGRGAHVCDVGVAGAVTNVRAATHICVRWECREQLLMCETFVSGGGP